MKKKSDTKNRLGMYLLSHMFFQMQLSPTRDSTPLTRDYMVDTERRYLEADQLCTANDRA